jgi:hypothetical protein
MNAEQKTVVVWECKNCQALFKTESEANKCCTYGCHCDLEEGQEPDGCVIDSGDYNDCIFAYEDMKKEDCKYWKKMLVRKGEIR